MSVYPECPEQNVRYVIETAYYGDVTVIRALTPDVFAVEDNTRPYEEYAPVYWQDQTWHCLDWTDAPNEFVLALALPFAVDDPLESPYARDNVLAILRGETSEVFQRELL